MAQPTQKQQAHALYRAGRSLKDIAAALNVSDSTVRSWKARGHWDNPDAALQQKMRRVATRKEPQRAALAAMLSDVEENDTLTDKQRAFCLHYTRTFNATQAAIRAGYAAGRGSQTGYEMLRKPQIAAEIQRLKQLRNTAMLAQAEDVVQKYMEIAFADLTDFVAWGRAEIDVMSADGPVMHTDPDTGETVALKKEVNDVRFRDSGEVDGTLVAEVKLGKDGASVKLADKMRALEWLGKYFELHPTDAHRRAYDRRKLELELLRTKATLPDAQNEAPPDDGFLTALGAHAQSMWAEGCEGDTPHAAGLQEDDCAPPEQPTEAAP